MMFNSFMFLVFFCLIIIMLIVLPGNFRKPVLLAASIFFYGMWEPKYLLLLLFAVLSSFALGLCIEKTDSQKRKKFFLITGLLLELTVLAFFKYANMAVSAFNSLTPLFRLDPVPAVDIVVPVGISFYIFQVVGYLIDVYRGDTKASRNIIDYSLFVSFFPQLVAGPIERSGSIIKQIEKIDTIRFLDIGRIRAGMFTMLWGYFMKVVVADRAALIADNVFENYKLYGSTELILGLLCFSLQIYCDFAGYSAIAVGTAKIVGIDLMDNFRMPYLSVSFKDFWSRWHISLSTWFRDYLYIPLGGNRKGKARKYVNIMAVMLISGLWHGAGLSFVVWGGIHGAYQVLEDIILPQKQRVIRKLKVNDKCFSWHLLETSVVYLLVCFAWVFFRANTIQDALNYLHRIVLYPDYWILFDGGVYSLGIDTNEYFILLFSVILLVIGDIAFYVTGKKPEALLGTQNKWFGWLVIILLVCSCVFFNCSGSVMSKNQFIYFQF